MKHHYADIRDRLGPPLWWDENGTPRYCEFAPDHTASVYWRQAALLLIECQGCAAEFKVCMSADWLDEQRGIVLSDVDELHYGDPPNAGCCPAGPTMNSIPRRVLEFWDRYAENGEFLDSPRRRAELEREIACDWAEDRQP